MQKPVVFLGGTCNNSQWRERLIPSLKIDYFNPVVEDWTPECQEAEITARENCDYCLYVITPLLTGTYSIAEVVDDSNKRPKKTIFSWINEDGGKQFDEFQQKSLKMVARMVEKNGGVFCEFKDLPNLLV